MTNLAQASDNAEMVVLASGPIAHRSVQALREKHLRANTNVQLVWNAVQGDKVERLRSRLSVDEKIEARVWRKQQNPTCSRLVVSPSSKLTVYVRALLSNESIVAL